MATITIRHTHAAGTLIEGSQKGDGVWEVLSGLRDNWRPFRSLGVLGIVQSRDKLANTYKIDRAVEALRAAGHDVTVEVDETVTRSFAEAERERDDRAQDRADRRSGLAERAGARAENRFAAEHQILGAIPPGQPILLGHYSQRRHERDLERAESHRRHGMEELGKSRYHERRAAAAAGYQASREDIPTTLRRIANLEADQRRVQRSIDTENLLAVREAAGKGLTHMKHSPDHLARMQSQMTDITEQLEHWRQHVAQAQAAGVKVWGRADFKPGDFVKDSRCLYEVLRVNPKTLTIPDPIYLLGSTVMSRAEAERVTRERQFNQMPTKTLPYDKVRARLTAEQVAELLATSTPGQQLADAPPGEPTPRERPAAEPADPRSLTTTPVSDYDPPSPPLQTGQRAGQIEARPPGADVIEDPDQNGLEL